MNPADEALAKLHAHERECEQFREYVKYRFAEQKEDSVKLEKTIKNVAYQIGSVLVAMLGYFEYFR